MTAEGRCEVHQLVRGPDGLCVLCKRSQSIGPLDHVSASPSASTRVGIVVSVAGVALLGAIAATVLLLPHADNEAAGSHLGATIATETPALPVPDPEAAARAAELSKIAKADIWKRAPEAPSAATDPGRIDVVPIPPLPATALSPAELEAQQRLAREEAERDRARHAEVAAELDRRAKEHERELQAAALSEARTKIVIDMYSAGWCGNCRKAIAYLQQQNGLRYTVHDIDREPGARDKMRALNPDHSVPTFQIDGDVVVGFGPRSLERALDIAARKRAGLPL